MSITKETALQHKDDPAVTCCRFEAGALVEASILEDPAIFGDLEDSGLLETKDLLEDIPETPLGEEGEEAGEEAEAAAGEAQFETVPVAQGAAPVVTGYATLKIAKGENIEISFPVYG